MNPKFKRSPLAPTHRVGAVTQEEALLRNYQSILILKPDLDEAQVDRSLEKITALIQKFGGSILKLDKWGKKRLAYRIRKSKFGYYLNIYHTCDQEGIAGLEKEYQVYDLVIKYLVIRLDEADVERIMSEKAESSESSESKETTEKKGSEKTETTEKSSSEKAVAAKE